jgi:sodium-independent sulfate anion transporter 11
MNRLSRTKAAVVESLKTDPNLNRARSWVDPIKRRLPSATAEYLVEKVPVIQWLPHYDYRWLFQDIIAGITIGVMFIPQGLAYAKIATIPVEHGLYSSWWPSAIYFFLGTSKELSTGPTSILGLLTAEVVADLSQEGYSPAAIASAIAFMVGIYALAVGLLKLGFLLDFVSGSVLSGWISAVALVILLGQVDSLVGLDAGSGTATIIRDVLGNLDKIQPLTLAIGFTSIALLLALEHTGKRWGKKNKWIKILSTSRAVVVLVLYTLISFLVNRGREVEDYKWEVTKVDTHGLLTPKAHDSTLISKVASRAFAPFIAMAVEHLGVGKAFGLRNNYQIDKSQELVFLGTENIINSFFGAMTTGGAMSRTAVNSECNVRTPLNFLFTSGFIILTLYELAPALYWIPKATLSAIIVSLPAVVPLLNHFCSIIPAIQSNAFHKIFRYLQCSNQLW